LTMFVSINFFNSDGMLIALGRVSFTYIVAFIIFIIMHPVVVYLLTFVLDLGAVGLPMLTGYVVACIIDIYYIVFYIDIDDICKNYVKKELVEEGEEDLFLKGE